MLTLFLIYNIIVCLLIKYYVNDHFPDVNDDIKMGLKRN